MMVNKELLKSLQKSIGNKNQPRNYSYTCFMHNGEKYIHFPQEYIYPLEIVEQIVKSCKKTSIDENKQIQVGLILQIPDKLNGIIKDSKLKRRVKHKMAKKSQIKAKPKKNADKNISKRGKKGKSNSKPAKK